MEGKLKVFKERRLEFNLQYDQFAPWGSSIARLEREVRVTEEQYLSVLHGLNQAKLQKQNLKFSNNLTIVDHPYLPLQPEKSKRMILVLLGFTGTLFTILGYLAAREFFDNTIKTPKRAIKSTRLPLLGALPYMPTKIGAVDVDSVNYFMVQQCVSNMILETENRSGVKRILVGSHLNREGKTWFCIQMQNRLNAIGRKSLIVLPRDKDKKDLEKIEGDYFLYDVANHFIDTENLSELGLKETERDLYDFVLLELPDQSTQPAPFKLISKADLCITIVNSGRVWTPSDINLVDIFNKANPKKHQIMLNAVPVDSLEDLMGTIPKRRSRLRQLVHNWLSQSLTTSRLKSY